MPDIRQRDGDEALMHAIYSEHGRALLAYATRLLGDRAAAEDAPCRRIWEELREMTDLLGEVPPEAFLNGPPEGDLVLQRTLRQMRAETAAQRRRRRLTVVAAAAVTLATVLGGGGGGRPGHGTGDRARPATRRCPGAAGRQRGDHDGGHRDTRHGLGPAGRDGAGDPGRGDL